MKKKIKRKKSNKYSNNITKKIIFFWRKETYYHLIFKRKGNWIKNGYELKSINRQRFSFWKFYLSKDNIIPENPNLTEEKIGRIW